MLQPVIVLVLVGLACSHGGQNKTKPGKNPSSLFEGQLIGGNPIPIGAAPWQVMLRKDGNLKCGGSLIGSRWVLTSAFCVKDVGEYSVRLGTVAINDFERGRVEMHIPQGNILIKPEYTTDGDDIALIKLPIALKLPVTRNGQIVIDSIRLAKKEDVLKDRTAESVMISGWGRDKPDDLTSMSPNLKFINVRVMSKTVCAETYSNLKSWETCANGFGGGGDTASCTLDNGDPVFTGDAVDGYVPYLIGMSSYQLDSTCLNGPEVFIRVAYFLDWIQGVTEIGI